MKSKQLLLTSLTQISATFTMLARNIIFARILSPDDYGMAMTFGVVLLFFEHLGNFGHDNFILRSKNGDKPCFQGTLHSTLLIRGVIISALFLLIAPSIPAILGIEETNFNYSYLAIIPLLNALVHLDFQRLTRQFDYSLTSKVGIASDLISITTAITLAYLYNNYWAFLISLIVKQTLFLAMSHLVAKRRYQLSFNYEHLKELYVFGLPILLISMIRYFSLETDKVIIVRYSGLGDFTPYILSALVIKQSISLSTTAFARIFIRRISRSNDYKEQLYAHKTNGVILLFITCPLLFTLSIAGEPIIHFVFGQQYKTILFLVPILCLQMSLRVSAFWLNQSVIATDKTSKMLICDVLRLFGFAFALLAAIYQQNILAIVGGFIIGEVIYIISLVILLKVNKPELPKLCFQLVQVSLSFTALAFLIYWQLIEASTMTKLLIAISMGTMICIAFLINSKVCRSQLFSILNTFKKLL